MRGELVGAHVGPELARDAGGHPVIDCGPCGFAHFWPRPGPAELAVYYRERFYETHSPPDWADKEEAEQPYWEIEYADRLAAFQEVRGSQAGRLLDVGCGAGWFLAHAAQRGWDVVGIEASRSMWERASRLAPVVLGTFPEVDLTESGPFDAVHLKLVMEHVPDPLSFLEEVRRLMAPGGVLCVEVPNDFNPLQRAVREELGKPPWWVVYPTHVNYFTFDSLERMLARMGFDPRLREATYPMEWFLLQGVDYVGRDDVGRQCHGQRMALEMSLERSGLSHLRRGFRRWLAAQGVGREAVVYARRLR
jgi:SAM-dependent methyltransferase